MDDPFSFVKSSKAGPIGLVTQSILGLALFPLLFINSISTNPLIPKEFAVYPFAYVGYLIVTLLIMSIVSYAKSTIKGKQCPHCGSSLEISKFKCKNPQCAKEL